MTRAPRPCVNEGQGVDEPEETLPISALSALLPMLIKSVITFA
jgi:hypothetical protein